VQRAGGSNGLPSAAPNHDASHGRCSGMISTALGFRLSNRLNRQPVPGLPAAWVPAWLRRGYLSRGRNPRSLVLAAILGCRLRDTLGALFFFSSRKTAQHPILAPGYLTLSAVERRRSLNFTASWLKGFGIHSREYGDGMAPRVRPSTV